MSLLKNIIDAVIIGTTLYFFLTGAFLTTSVVVNLIINRINKRKILKKLDKISELKKV